MEAELDEIFKAKKFYLDLKKQVFWVEKVSKITKRTPRQKWNDEIGRYLAHIRTDWRKANVMTIEYWAKRIKEKRKLEINNFVLKTDHQCKGKL